MAHDDRSSYVENNIAYFSKKQYGASHVLSKEEAKFVFDKGCEQLILGSGQAGNVRLSPEAEAYFDEFPDKPKCMHWTTYDRLRRAHDAAKVRATMGLMRFVDRFRRMLR